MPHVPLPFDTPPGARLLEDGRATFVVWSPRAGQVELALYDPPRRLPMQRDAAGYWRAGVEGLAAGARYRYVVDGQAYPDPASRWQPEGVHGPSALVDDSFTWGDDGWAGAPLQELVVYELHVGAFTSEGTFEAIIPHLPALRELGVTAIELMPVAHFPGERNWGYDGVYLYAPHTAYGGVTGLKRLVDAAHREGLAVLLDVVYNHFGPEGNYLWSVARPFFTGRYHTPWGDAINYDGPESDAVRHFVIASALHWLREYHLDGLRLDAVQAIFDLSAYHLLEELADAARAQAAVLGRPALLIAESDLNDPRLIAPPELGGYGLDAHWADDLHHALHAALTGERGGYYEGFGQLAPIATALQRAYVYAGDYAAHRRRRFGRAPAGRHPAQFVVCCQNHDQVGNRALGDRLSALLSFEQLKLVAAAYLLSPFTPLIFMGEEYGESAPFQYFTHHGDAELIKNVREGRRREFADMVGAAAAVPDPQDPATFQRSKLNHQLRGQGRHRALYSLYRELLRLRREMPGLRPDDLAATEAAADEDARTLVWRRQAAGAELWAGLNFADAPRQLALPPGRWEPLLDTAGPRWAAGQVSQGQSRTDMLESQLELHPHSCLLLRKRA
jgi:maltooligosyltrehalose trehalohydrolase